MNQMHGYRAKNRQKVITAQSHAEEKQLLVSNITPHVMQRENTRLSPLVSRKNAFCLEMVFWEITDRTL